MVRIANPFKSWFVHFQFYRLNAGWLPEQVDSLLQGHIDLTAIHTSTHSHLCTILVSIDQWKKGKILICNLLTVAIVLDPKNLASPFQVGKETSSAELQVPRGPLSVMERWSARWRGRLVCRLQNVQLLEPRTTGKLSLTHGVFDMDGKNKRMDTSGQVSFLCKVPGLCKLRKTLVE